MLIIKYCILIIILGISIGTGLNISKKFQLRVRELIEMRNALNIFEDKIKFTYEPIPDVFREVSTKCMKSIGNIFSTAAENMKIMTAGEAWEKAVDSSNTSMTKDDLSTIKDLAKMLGKIDLDGQVSEIKLASKFLETKINDAETERNKNQKLYKTLGTTVGLVIVIILI